MEQENDNASLQIVNRKKKKGGIVELEPDTNTVKNGGEIEVNENGTPP